MAGGKHTHTNTHTKQENSSSCDVAVDHITVVLDFQLSFSFILIFLLYLFISCSFLKEENYSEFYCALWIMIVSLSFDICCFVLSIKGICHSLEMS